MPRAGTVGILMNERLTRLGQISPVLSGVYSSKGSVGHRLTPRHPSEERGFLL